MKTEARELKPHRPDIGATERCGATTHNADVPLFGLNSNNLKQVAEMAVVEQSVVRSMPNNHPNIVKFHDAGISKVENEIRYFILSEYCPSNVLKKMSGAAVSVKQAGNFSWASLALRVGRDIGAGLESIGDAPYSDSAPIRRNELLCLCFASNRPCSNITRIEGSICLKRRYSLFFVMPQWRCYTCTVEIHRSLTG